MRDIISAVLLNRANRIKSAFSPRFDFSCLPGPVFDFEGVVISLCCLTKINNLTFSASQCFRGELFSFVPFDLVDVFFGNL